jgi:hypothetical protein
MIRLLSFLLLAAPAAAAERIVQVGSFERLRVDGPIAVTVAAGSPRATVDGDARVIDRLTVRLEGRTLVVRMSRDDWAEQGRAQAGAPIRLTLSTPALTSIVISSGADVRAAGMKADRVDLSVTGTGSIAVTGVQGTQLNATVIGTGTIAMAGRTNTARLLDNGPGTIDAEALDASELVVRVDGPGTIRARARYTARITNTGTGSVTIAGQPKCIVEPGGGGIVDCG